MTKYAVAFVAYFISFSISLSIARDSMICVLICGSAGSTIATVFVECVFKTCTKDSFWNPRPETGKRLICILLPIILYFLLWNCRMKYDEGITIGQGRKIRLSAWVNTIGNNILPDHTLKESTGGNHVPPARPSRESTTTSGRPTPTNPFSSESTDRSQEHPPVKSHTDYAFRVSFLGVYFKTISFLLIFIVSTTLYVM